MPRQLILQLVDGFMDASIRKDVSFMRRHLHTGFIFTTPKGTFFTYESFFVDFLLNRKCTLLKFNLLQEHMILQQDLALVNAVAQAQFQNAKEQFECISFLWIPGQDDWSLLQIHSTFTAKAR
jgi:hypothetical protein